MNSVNAGILSAIIFAMVGTFHLGAYFTGEGIKVAEYAVNLFSVSPSAETVELPNYNGSDSGSSKATLCNDNGSNSQAHQEVSEDKCERLNGCFSRDTNCCYESSNYSGSTYFCKGLNFPDRPNESTEF